MDEQDLRLLQRQADICKVLGNVKRLQIIYLLQAGEMAAGDLAAALETTAANVSQHLTAMKQVGVLESRREGSNIFYRLADRAVLDACGMVNQVLREQMRREQELYSQTGPVR